MSRGMYLEVTFSGLGFRAGLEFLEECGAQ